MSRYAERQLNAPGGLEAEAHRRGFPSSGAMEAVIRLAVKLRQGGTVTDADVARLSTHYSAVPYAMLEDAARQINMQPDASSRFASLVGAVAGDGEAILADAERIVSSYEQFDASHEVMQRLDTRDVEQQQQLGRKAEAPARTDPFADQRQSYVKTDIRKAIEAQLSPGPQRLGDVKHRLADRLEQASAKLHGEDRSDLRAIVAASFDQHAVNEIVDAEELLERDDDEIVNPTGESDGQA